MRRNRPKAAVAGAAGLPPDMLANIHGRLSLLDRLAFAAAFRMPVAPWLVLPGDTLETATLFSLADRRSAVVRAPGPDHLVLGSSFSRGWLVTADAFARLRIVNPVTGERHALPAIDTIPCLNANCGRHHFTFRMMWFLRGPPPYPSFKVQVLGAGREEWKVTDDIGETALFVGGNGSLCVSTREHPELRAGCVYYTEDDPGRYKDAGDHYYNGVGVFSLKDGRREKVEGLGRQRSWPPPVWFMPSIP